MKRKNNIPTYWKMKQLGRLKNKKANKQRFDNQEGYAVDEVTQTEEDVFISATERGRQFAKNQYAKHKENRMQSKRDMSNQGISSFRSGYVNNRTIISQRNNLNRRTSTYNQQMRQYVMNKQIQKTMKSSSTGIKQSASFIKDVTTKAVMIVKTSVASVSNLIGFGTGLILLLVITLFIGVFASLSSDAGINSATKPLNAEVINYRATIEQYAEKYDVEEYVSLIQAIMMVESEGKGNDPMDASGLSYNTKYPNGITDKEYSIDVGVHYFADCIRKAQVNDKTNIKSISLAVQAYDYGLDYIEWANVNFGGYTRANAKVYYEQVSNQGNPLYVLQVLEYYHLMNGNIVQIAQTQVGNIGGEPYWTWYGYNHRVEWCAVFVSWCANEAGLLEQGLCPKFAGVYTGIDWFKSRDKWLPKGSIPEPGDLIFFDWENDGGCDHVGIVQKVENGYIYTIEGNSNDECKNLKYRIGSQYIYGFGMI